MYVRSIPSAEQRLSPLLQLVLGPYITLLCCSASLSSAADMPQLRKAQVQSVSLQCSGTAQQRRPCSTLLQTSVQSAQIAVLFGSVACLSFSQAPTCYSCGAQLSFPLCRLYSGCRQGLNPCSQHAADLQRCSALLPSFRGESKH